MTGDLGYVGESVTGMLSRGMAGVGWRRGIELSAQCLEDILDKVLLETGALGER